MPSRPSVEIFTHTLYACKNTRNHVLTTCFSPFIHGCGLDGHTVVGNSLISVLVEFGLLNYAQRIFTMIASPSADSWNSLIIASVKYDDANHALSMYCEAQNRSIYLNACTSLALIKACRTLKNVDTGFEIHTGIAKEGLDSHLTITSSLVDMYCKCGFLAEAKKLFDALPTKDTISWNTLISGFNKCGHDEEALSCYYQMQSERTVPSNVTFICSLKACYGVGAVCEGQMIHIEILKKGFDKDFQIGTTLTEMYVAFGLLEEAKVSFDNIPLRNVVSWNALISGFIREGRGHEALNCSEQMLFECIAWNSVTYVCNLKACGSMGAADKAQELCAEIFRTGLENNSFVGSALVDVYIALGSLMKAHEVFGKLIVRSVVTWNTLITGYSNHGLPNATFDCLKQMQLEGISPDMVTYSCCLKACNNIELIGKGQEIHLEIVNKGLELDLSVACSLVYMYANCGWLSEAQYIFKHVQIQNVAIWTSLIAGHVMHGHPQNAIHLFKQMKLECIFPNSLTHVCVLKACSSIKAIEEGCLIHLEIENLGLLKDDFAIGNAIVDLYAKCGLMNKAHQVFDKLLFQDTVSWNALIAGYTTNGFHEEALTCFKEMQYRGFTPDAFTYASCLKACGCIGYLDHGREIHCEVVRNDMTDMDTVVGNAVVDMYIDCSLLEHAHEVFDCLHRDVITWTLLIVGYMKNDRFEEAFHLSEQMQLTDIAPNLVTFICILKACGRIGAADKGQEIHTEVARKGFPTTHLIVGNTLVDMYANCGLHVKAQEVFDGLQNRDAVSWNALIAGYAQLGASKHALYCLDKMIEAGEEPHMITFISILNACSHSGLVDEGLSIFEIMCKLNDILVNLDHYACLIDLLGRTGQLTKAAEIAEKMPFHPNFVVWHSVLNASWKWCSLEIGKQAFEHAVNIDDKDAMTYLYLSKIHRDVNLQSIFNDSL